MLKKLLIILTLFLCIPFTQIHAGSDVYVEDTLDVLTYNDKQNLEVKAKEISDKYHFGVYAYFIYDDTGESYDYMDSFIEEYYSDHDLGYGDTSDGVLLLITQTSQGNTYQVYVPGNADQSAFTLDGMNHLDDAAYSYLREHEYYDACDSYLDEVEELFEYYNEYGEAYGDNEAGFDSNDLSYAILFVLPPIIALIIVLIMKSKNKTSRVALEAHDYIPENGVNITNSRDFFLYRTTHRTPIHHDEPHGDGGAHFSSSGGMHSGGGHF